MLIALFFSIHRFCPFFSARVIFERGDMSTGVVVYAVQWENASSGAARPQRGFWVIFVKQR
jgi:hypothetical protein